MPHAVRADQRLSDHRELNAVTEGFPTAIHPLPVPVTTDWAALKFATLGEMTAGIVHDFRNVLAVIDSSLRLASIAEEGQCIRHYLDSAREGVAVGAKLTRQLLAFARDGTLASTTGDANELLKNLQPLLKHAVGPGIRVSYDLALDIPRCVIEPSQFNIAILNLVINARDAMLDGGDIQISTMRWTAEPDLSRPLEPVTYVRVQVRDYGPGMTKDVAQQIFKPFFTTKGEVGTGLGLPQVYALTQLVGGHVSVTSEQGLGTTFELYFPAVEAH